MNRKFLNLELLATIIFVAFIGVFTSCEKEESVCENYPEETIKSFEKAKIVLKKLGFGKDPVLLNSEIVAVSDVSFKISSLEATFKSMENNSRNKSYINRVYYTTVWRTNNIVVNIPSDVPTNWRKAIKKAVNKWNSLDIRLNFSITENDAQVNNGINIKYCDFYEEFSDPNYQQLSARSEFPYNGYPGSLLRINSNSNVNYSLIMHEIGHTLGFLHPEETNLVNDPYLDIVSADPEKSIMYHVVSYNKEFFYADKIFFKKIY